MPKIEEFYPSRALGRTIMFIIKDGALRSAHTAQVRALRERLRCANDAIILGILDHF